MTIDEAIRVFTVLQEAPVLKNDQKVVTALKLGIEALLEVERARDGNPPLDGELLPGETEK